jgi:predicted Rossmann fold flavoprotein
MKNEINQTTRDVIIIGAGAAGLMATIAAGNIRVQDRAARVLLLDGKEKIGAKILVAGGGRCNVTNEFVHPSRFHTQSDPNGAMAFKGDGLRSFVGRILRAFSPESTHRFFESIGVILKLEETGKYFPITDSARTVLNALLQAVQDSGAELRTGILVQGIERDGYQWRVITNAGVLTCRALVICTGGLALPKSGSDGAGLQWAKAFGHRLVFTTPALSPLLCHNSPHAHLSGIAVPVRLRFQGKDRVDYDGSLLFTHTGYSGPVALNISRHVAREKGIVTMRLLPDIQDGGEGGYWQELVKRHSKKALANALMEYFPRRVCETIETQALGALPCAPTMGRLNSEQQKRVREILFEQKLKIDAVADYVKAEATAGGVALDEIEPATMMSKLHDGLFFAGEVCDVDGWLGGYNFQWAWSSGTVAGRAAARWGLRR